MEKGTSTFIRSSKEIALMSVMVALLLAGQLVLSAVQGVEIVTVLFLAFCTVFGARRGVIVATVFSLLRCLLFGFFFNVVILYLVYYNLFAIMFGLLGRALNRLPVAARIVLITVAAVLVTACFTLLDDLLTPWILGYAPKSRRAYFYASLPALGIQSVCSAVTVSLLWYPLVQIFEKSFAEIKKEKK